MTTALLDRRTVLRGGLAVGAAFLVAGAVTLPGAGAGLLTLSTRERELVEAMAVVLFPGTHFPLDGVQADVVVQIDRILADDVSAVAATGFRYVLRAIEIGTLASHGRRFSDLPTPEQQHILDAWAAPGLLPRRLAFDGVKMMFGMAYFRHPEIQAHMGYRSACSGGNA